MATGSISQIKLPNGSTYDLKDASLHQQAGILSSDGVNVAGVSENYFRPTIKVFDAAPVRSDLSVVRLSADDYYELVANNAALSNVIYVVDDVKINAYDEQIKNLAAGIDDTDAVNMAQFSAVSARIDNTYTKAETDQKIANAQYFKKYVVQTLPPVADADERGIYLVPSSDPQTQNTYDEYVVVGEGSSKAWEKIGAKNIDLSGYKTKQTAKTSPTASSTTTSFIDTITQNENGEITATKKTVQSATTSQAGIVQLNNTLTSTATNQAATANVVKSLNDAKVETSIKVAGQALTADVTAATISSAIGLGNYALDISALHKTGDETAAGKKTFSDAFTVGTRASGSAVGTNSFAYGTNNTASGECSFAGGQDCVATAYCAHAEGYCTSATQYLSHAEGQITLASGYCSHAEGYGAKATASYVSHAEGLNTVAAGDCSHAEGSQVSATAGSSHAEGDGTIAQNTYEHAQGSYNFSNSGNDYALQTIDSVGIGNYTARKNATEVMRNGDAYFLGVGGYDGTNAASATSKPLAAVLSAKADIDSLNYMLSTATGVLSSGSYVYDVADRTVTTIGINQSTTPVIVRLPDAGNGARDFILRIEISSETAPTFTFTNTTGLDFESEDDDWAIMEPGVNLVSFTETKR